MKNIPDFRTARTSLATELGQLYEAREAEAIAQLLIEHCSGKDRQTLLLSGTKLSPEHWKCMQDKLPALTKGTPVQYVLGEAHFYGRRFKITPGVLIPRGETEELVLWLRDTLERYTSPRILDIGTGSGCIPITLALETPHKIEVMALDSSKTALGIAQENASRFGVDLAASQQDIFEAKADLFQNLDAIVSNPPYIPIREKVDLALNVRDFEPEEALFVPNESPLLFYEKIALLGKDWLKTGGLLFFESHENYAEELAKLLSYLGYQDVELKKDLHRKPRMLKAKKA